MAEDIAVRKMRELSEDKAQVEWELSRYEAAGIVTSFENSGMVNIDEFWSVSHIFCLFFVAHLLIYFTDERI